MPLRMRKSPDPLRKPEGNVEKYSSYREAWTRINLACEHEFYLEAVALVESIITDRLIVYLSAVEAIERPVEVRGYPRFNTLLQKWRKHHPEPIIVGAVTDLHAAVDRWRNFRNEVVHGMVKSHPGTPTTPIDEFLAHARLAAHEGRDLAKAVSSWSKKTLKTIPRRLSTGPAAAQPFVQ